MTTAYINRVAIAVPEHQAHDTFIRFAGEMLPDCGARLLFDRMVDRSQIERRWTCLTPPRAGCNEALDGDHFYIRGQFPSTAQRMSRYEAEAPTLGAKAVGRLDLDQATTRKITHLIVASCTGFSAPGVDLELVERCGLDPSVERTVVGFMGCHAAINALKLSRHIVRSCPEAQVLVVCLELCTLHLQETDHAELVQKAAQRCRSVLEAPAGDGLDSLWLRADRRQRAMAPRRPSRRHRLFLRRRHGHSAAFRAIGRAPLSFGQFGGGISGKACERPCTAGGPGDAHFAGAGAPARPESGALSCANLPWLSRLRRAEHAHSRRLHCEQQGG